MWDKIQLIDLEFKDLSFEKSGFFQRDTFIKLGNEYLAKIEGVSEDKIKNANNFERFSSDDFKNLIAIA
ncbi:hypothetical protein QUB05_32235 [Microcoleus sp. F10-C6]|uniref:hypothetical protein n=1 Tax=unclassified Microcoleus TaxID=2642155 RepID=UPI002FCF4D4E